MNKKVKAVIIEDEYPAARLLNKMIQNIRPDWEVTILPGTIEGAVNWFSEHVHPDIIFLDIQLNDGNSFIFIEQAKPQSMIVFTTAYDEYAVRAFTVNSIDYLLKPVHEARLLDAVLKFERLSSINAENARNLSDIEFLLQSLAGNREKQYRTRFLIYGARHLYTIQVADIAYFYSEEKVTFAVTRDGKAHAIDFTLNKLEEQLDSKLFFRANRQFILSADSIKSIQNYFNGKAVVNVLPPHNEAIYISREKVSLLKMWLNS
ncbi:lytTr DNA-binding domain protein [Bacteroides sp. CAG:1076]|jgi:DNA-binding LytR/AlgR family response regulator|nr:lytTr DNA-binding domain protein [Bacteroides sp. CAG:1076]